MVMDCDCAAEFRISIGLDAERSMSGSRGGCGCTRSSRASLLGYLSEGDPEFDRPLKREILVFSLRLGRLRVRAMLFDRLGGGGCELMSMCVGISSGSRVAMWEMWFRAVESEVERSGNGMGLVPGISTPETWRASKGRDIDIVRVGTDACAVLWRGMLKDWCGLSRVEACSTG